MELVSSCHAGVLMMQTGTAISKMMVQQIANLEKETNKIKASINEFEIEISPQFKEEQDLTHDGAKPNSEDRSEWCLENNPDFQEEFDNIVNDPTVLEFDDDFALDAFDDTHVNMELATPRDGEMPDFARATKRLRDKDGLPTGKANNNPILDARMCKVEHKDGHKALLAANAIAGNMLAQVNDKGNRHILFKATADQQTDRSEAKQQDAFMTTRSGPQGRREMRKGWEILVQWKDGSTTLVMLKDMKNSCPVQLAKHASQRRVAGNSSFVWWIQHVLNKHNCIIGKLKGKCWACTHKFGVKIPKIIEEAKRFNAENGDALWWDTACKEMKNVRPAFEVWETEILELPPGCQQIAAHMIFDIKMGENFLRKARFVADGHKTKTPGAMCCSSVVSRDSVWIALMI
jgi:hypothetical protein